MDTRVLLLALVCMCACVGASTHLCNDPLCGCQVIRASLTTQAHVRAVEDMNLDVWSHSSLPHIGTNDIMVCGGDLDSLKSHGIQYELMIDDLYETYTAVHTQNENLREDADWFSEYHPLDEIKAYCDDLAKAYPQLLKFTPSVGQSIEKRDISVLHISNGKSDDDKQKILLLGGQHAREWISPATVMYIAHKLLTGYGNDSVVTNLLDSFDVVIVPVLNADGYTYTWLNSNTRLWRKNRRHNSDGSYGVDLNRNWGFHWCESGASKTPSSDTYCGTGPFSEPETQTIRNISTAFGPFSGAIDFHSYGQLLMRPYGYTSDPPPNNAELTRIADGMRDVMKATTGVQYTSQAIWQLYLSAGSSADYWVSINIPYSYGFEARDTGKYGFLLPPTEIAPSGEENFAAVNYMASQIKKK